MSSILDSDCLGVPTSAGHTMSSLNRASMSSPPISRLSHLAAIIESSEDAIIGGDLDGVISAWNRGAEQLYGYSAAEVIGRSISLLIPPELSDDFPAIMQKIRSGERVAHYETLRKRKDGRLVPISLSVSPIRDETGKIVGASAIAREISERKLQEPASRKSEEHLRSLADTTPVPIWMSGTDRLCTYFNKAWLEFTGRSLGSELGNGWADGVQPEDLPRCLDTYTQSFDRREKFRMEYRLRHHSGTYRWILDVGVPRFNEDGSFAGYIGTGVDITDRKLAEDTLSQLNHALEERTMLLQASGELLKVFVRHVPAAVAMFDRDMRYLEVSDRWCADFSLDASTLLGRSHYEVFPDIPERWREIHRRCLSGEIVRAEEDRWDRKGGATWLRWEIRPWQSVNGAPGGMLIFSEDLTKRKQAEAALSDVSRQLVLAQEQERARIGRELHDDINQRLALLSVEIEQLKNLLPLKVDEVAIRLDAMQTTVIDMSSCIQALSHELHASKLDYLGIVPAMRSFCQEFAKQQQLEVDFGIVDVPGSVSSDISLCLFRVLQEALHNAAKHSAARHFKVQLRGASDEIHLTVSDSGVGFDPETAAKGAGLGLISMRQRLHLVKGEISIDSQPKHGTTIHARVPLA